MSATWPAASHTRVASRPWCEEEPPRRARGAPWAGAQQPCSWWPLPSSWAEPGPRVGSWAARPLRAALPRWRSPSARRSIRDHQPGDRADPALPAGDSVRLLGDARRGTGTDTILVGVARLDAGVRTVVQEPSVQHILPEARTFAFPVQTDDLIAAWGTGDFEMRIFFDAAEPPFAVGTFTLVETPPG